MISSESIWHIIKQSIMKSKKLFWFSFIIIIVFTVMFYLTIFLIPNIEGYLTKFITIFGFISTLYSVFLTIILYHFISFSDTEFIINSNKFVENNKKLILQKTLDLSNFLKDSIQFIHTEGTSGKREIPANIREDFLFLITLNKSHVNEKTSLYKCRQNFYDYEKVITEINIDNVSDICKVELTKLSELWKVLTALNLNLATIFDKE